MDQGVNSLISGDEENTSSGTICWGYSESLGSTYLLTCLEVVQCFNIIYSRTGVLSS